MESASAQENALNLGTPVIDATPQVVGESAMASELPGAPLHVGGALESGLVEGTVRGVMFDVALGKAQYLVVDGGTADAPELFLLPPGVLKLTRIAPEKEVGAGSSEEDFAGIEYGMAGTPQAQATAAQPENPGDLPVLPGEALNIWQQTGSLPKDWDAAARRFWAAQRMDERMSGAEADGIGPVFFVGSFNPAAAGQGADRAALFNDPRWKVHAENGDAIGQIWELFFDPQGSAVFAVLRLPDFLGQGEARVIVPWKRLVWSAEKQAFTVTATLEVLAAAPVFDPDALPDFSVPGWESDWQAYWQEDRSGAPQQQPTSSVQIGQTLATRLIGTPLNDAAGTQVGVVEDIILGPDGNIIYLLLRMKDMLRPVPWMAFDYSEDRLIYIDDTARLTDAPGYPSVNGIDPSQARWDAQIRSYWGLGR